MTYDTYRLIFTGFAILAGLMLTVSVALFFLLKIPAVIGNLTGFTARKAIERIRSRNEADREKTAQIKRKERNESSAREQPGSSDVRQDVEQPHAVDGRSDTNTIILDQETVPMVVPVTQAAENEFIIEYEITFIHTDEVINVTA